MSIDIHCEFLTAERFAPFGDVLECAGAPDRIINAGLCDRYHDRAMLDFGKDGRAGISLFNAEPRSMPYVLDLMERHPEGSQAFVPMTENPFLVIVAADEDDRPGKPRAFLTKPHQGVNFHKGIWHGVLTPLASPGLFAVIDRIGDTPNLQEVLLDPPYRVLP
ncbi:ureidoglycolate lyase [Roseobacter sp. YSTF-M11]|uniref:Ureidoglycolate lyase n=1 Tax=Roseobacter insulae TaxID=2859783 RepID=A0A9X1JWT4_9RHOB|nr:ureidoglycolate lyase [Roseobacter insulae]MBW4706500.1 ureidoglycolate lyase [Roseobacter insulae]